MRTWLSSFILMQLVGGGALLATYDAPIFSVPRRETSPRLIDPDHWIAVVGDSGVTGAASDPELSANVFSMLERFGSRSLLSALDVGGGTTNRVLYSQRELSQAERRGATLELRGQALGAETVDRVENAFGARVGRALGVNARDVVVVGQDGKRVSAIPTQLERVYEVGTGTLPPLVLVSFTANDFCDVNVFTDTLETRVNAFEKSLAEAWSNSRGFLRAHARGTEFVVLAPLDVENVLTNPAILNQRVPLGVFGSVSCREMRENTLADAPIAGAIARKFIGMCPAVLGTKPGDVDRIARLRDVQKGFNQVWKRQVAALNRAYGGQGLSWRYVEGTRHLDIGAGDVANECFHPSAGGHQKIAAEILRGLVNRVAAQ